ncbi:MAG: hypothetical protein HQK53_08900 [Oligoflexia bacterium]|nr:hypothetical protein [Oligoflexia bacterium]
MPDMITKNFKIKFFATIRWKIMISIVVPLFIILFISFAILVKSEREYLVKSTQVALGQLETITSKLLQGQLMSFRQEVETFSASEYVVSNFKSSSRFRLLAYLNVLTQKELLDGVTVFSSDGKIFASLGVPISDFSYDFITDFKKIQAREVPVFYAVSLKNELFEICMSPVFQGNILDYMGMEMSGVLLGIRKFKFNNMFSGIVLANNQNILSSSENSKFIVDNIEKIRTVNQDLIIIDDYSKVFSKIKIPQINKNDIMMIIGIDNSIDFAKQQKLLIIVIIIGLCSLVLLLGLAVLLSKTITSRLENLLKAVEKINFVSSENDLKIDWPKIKEDEIGILTLSLMDMTRNVQRLIYETGKQKNEILESNRRLENHIKEKSSTVVEVISLSKNTSEEIENIHKFTDRVNSMAIVGSNTMKDMYDSVVAIKNSNVHLEQLNHLVHEISKKTDVINEIVFQIKILSFNASIESNRAGIHGKGFGVVAQEIQKLAVSSRKAAEKINDLIERSAERVTSVVSIIQEKVDRSKEICDSSVTLFENISGDLKTIDMQVSNTCGSLKERTEKITTDHQQPI